jgi:hypothetical protein
LHSKPKEVAVKFVRWLGAFGVGSSLTEAVSWELNQVERQVAVEPLWRGQSFIGHVTIGLAVDHSRSRFARGWLYDAYTVPHEDGSLRATRHRKAEFKNMDRFLAAWNKQRPFHHGEVAFDSPVYRAVVVKSTASDRGFRRAKRLASKLGLPLKILKEQ